MDYEKRKCNELPEIRRGDTGGSNYVNGFIVFIGQCDGVGQGSWLGWHLAGETLILLRNPIWGVKRSEPFQCTAYTANIHSHWSMCFSFTNMMNGFQQCSFGLYEQGLFWPTPGNDWTGWMTLNQGINHQFGFTRHDMIRVK